MLDRHKEIGPRHDECHYDLNSTGEIMKLMSESFEITVWGTIILYQFLSRFEYHFTAGTWRRTYRRLPKIYFLITTIDIKTIVIIIGLIFAHHRFGYRNRTGLLVAADYR